MRIPITTITTNNTDPISKNLCVCVCQCMCVCVCAYACECICVYVCKGGHLLWHVWKSRGNLGYWPSPSIVFDTGSLVARRAGPQASVWRLSCLCLPLHHNRTSSIDVYNHDWLYMGSQVLTFAQLARCLLNHLLNQTGAF